MLRVAICALALASSACDAIVGVGDIIPEDASADGRVDALRRDAPADRARPVDVAKPLEDAGEDADSGQDGGFDADAGCTPESCAGGCCDSNDTCQLPSDTQCGIGASGCTNCFFALEGIACIDGTCGCNASKDCPWGDGGTDVACTTSTQQCCMTSGVLCSIDGQCCSGSCESNGFCK